MRSSTDPLYTIFEQHLFNSIVEDETTEEFLDQVVAEYLSMITSGGTIAPEHRADIEGDLREEVLEMLRKKTYGHFNLAEYRKKKVAASSSPSAVNPNPASPGANARRARRSS